MRPDNIASREDLETYLSEQCGDLYEHEHLRSQIVDRLAQIVEEEAYRAKLLYGGPGWAEVIDLCWPDSDVGDKRFFQNVNGILGDLRRQPTQLSISRADAEKLRDTLCGEVFRGHDTQFMRRLKVGSTMCTVICHYCCVAGQFSGYVHVDGTPIDSAHKASWN